MKTRIIQTRFYDDEYIADECDLFTQHLYLYLITCQYINISAKFQLSDSKMKLESKLDAEQLKSAKEKLQTDKKVIFYKGWVFVVNAMKNNNYTNSPKNIIAYKNELSKVPKEVEEFFHTTINTSIDSSMDSSQNSDDSHVSDSTIDTSIDSTHKSKTINHKSKIKNQNKGGVGGIEVEVVSEGKIVNEIIELFEPINPSFKNFFPNKSQRKAIERLLKEHGEEKLKAIVKNLPDAVSRPYAPRITTPVELENKLGSLIIFMRQESQKRGGVVDAIE